MSVDMSQFFDVFFEESHEHLHDMEHLLMELSLDDPDIEDLNSIFRAAHSIKGGSGVFGFDALTGLTHVMENILDLARNDEIVMTKAIVDQLLITVDTLKNILQCYQNESEIDWEAIELGTVALEKLLKPDDSSESEQKASAEAEEIEGFGMFDNPVTKEDEEFGFFDPVDATPEDSAYDSSENQTRDNEATASAQSASPVETDNDSFGFFDEQSSPDQVGADKVSAEQAKSGAAEIEGFGLFDKSATEKQQTPAKTETPTAKENKAYGFFEEHPSAAQLKNKSNQASGSDKAPASVSSIKAKAAQKKSAPKAKADSKESSSIRVDTLKIDSLVNLVGELVITQSMIKIVGKEVHGETEEKLEGAIGELSRNIREIQEAVMSMRMLPMSFAFNRFPRVVRDLADKLGKNINLVIEGGATEIDKGMIEKLVDPLTHLIRNSVDHGIEMPDVREAAGKIATGTVILNAEQRGGSIIITITDDGAGLNREKILEKAVTNGLEVSDDISDTCLLYTSPSPRDRTRSRMPSSA